MELMKKHKREGVFPSTVIPDDMSQYNIAEHKGDRQLRRNDIAMIQNSFNTLGKIVKLIAWAVVFLGLVAILIYLGILLVTHGIQ